MKSMHVKRFMCLFLSLLLLLSALPVSVFAADESVNEKQEPFSWKGFEEFSSEVSDLLGETMEDNYISAVTLEVGSAEMVVDGEEKPVVEGRSVTPITKDDAIMLPVRALAECENAEVGYDGKTYTATVQTEDSEIAFTPGEATAAIDDGKTGEESLTPLSTEPELIDGTMYVPLSDMANFLGYDTEFIEEKAVLTKPYQTKRLIVKSEETELETHGAVREISGFHDLHILQYETEEAAEEAREKLMLADGVDYVEPDAVVSTMEVHKSWGTDYIGADEYNLYLQENTDLNEVVVAVVDSGVDSEHTFLKDRIIPVNKNFVNSDPNSNDGDGHGTHVAGIVVDATLPNVKILPVKVLNDSGQGTTLSVYNGAMFAIEQNCDVINMSLGGYGKSQLDQDMVLAALSRKIPVVAAAGNDSVDAGMVSPANVEEAITVGAIGNGGFHASYSNYGSVVDIWAPGSDVLSSIPGNDFTEKSGTSMAAPHVAAAAAMLKTYDKNLSPRQIEGILEIYAKDRNINEPEKPGNSKVLRLDTLKNLQSSETSIVEKPEANVEPGEYYQEELSVSLSCETPGAVIRYTTDGTVPTEDTGEIYAGPLILRESTNLLAKAFKTGSMESYLLDNLYCVSLYPESLHNQKYNYYDTWTYIYPDSNAKYLKITFDETTYIPFPPLRENGPGYIPDYYNARLKRLGLYLYDAEGQPVNNEYADIDRNYFIYDELQGKSVIVSGDRFSIFLKMPFTNSDYGFKIKNVEPLYEERLSAPQFVTPCGNTYAPRVEYAKFMLVASSKIHYVENRSVTLSSPEGGDIYYTLDGSLPTRRSLKYTGPISLNEPKKIRAKAFKEGYVESKIASETYYSSKYPESLHDAKRDYIFRNGWEWTAPSNVKYMAVTFDEKTFLGDPTSTYQLSLEIYSSHSNNSDIGRQFPTRFYGAELAGRTLYIRGNYFKLYCDGDIPEGKAIPYGFKITDIHYYYNESDIIPIENIEISGPDSVGVGWPAQMTATVTPANANTGFFWRMQFYNYASVDENGVVTGKRKGRTKLYATSNFINSIMTYGGVDSIPPSYIVNGAKKDIIVEEEPTPTGQITYSTESFTTQWVVATLILPNDYIRVTNNGGKTSYTFFTNGTFTFELESKSGKKGSVVAKVDWIDNTPPKAELVCSPETPTNGDVVVTMIPSEEVTVTEPADGSTTKIVTENGTVRFEFADRAGNTGFVEKEITWIDKSDLTASISYQNLEDGRVKAFLETSKPVTILNNDGSNEFVFNLNRTFTFEFAYEEGKTGSATAVVYWIKTPSLVHVYFPEDLVALGQQINQGDLPTDISIILEADLDMSGITWTPIGTPQMRFNGQFDGNGHTISHLKFERKNYSCSGLFGWTGTNSSIRNLKMKDISVVGMIAGGVVGRNEGGQIKNCVVTGNIQGKFYIGGIVGMNSGNGTILDCHMRGNLVRKDALEMGGIAGRCTNSSILRCSMSGTITTEEGSDSNTIARGLGGIVGNCIDNSTICECYSLGTISCSTETLSLGGIAGTLKDNSTLKNCYSIMELRNSGVQKESGVGGIVGAVKTDDGSAWLNCFALNERITGNHDVGRVAGKDLSSTASESEVIGYSFSGMLVGPKGSEAAVEDAPDSPLRHFNGKGKSKEEIRTQEFWETAGFSFENDWIWEEGKMPYFKKDMASDWPEWLALEMAVLTKSPQVRVGLEYTGMPQELIVPGEAEGGTLKYSLQENGEYSESLPTATNAGSYTVWYRVTGDISHTGLAPASLSVTIAKAAQPEHIPEDMSVPDGTTLSSVTLPDGWSWKDPQQSLSTGANQVTVVYGDTDNYEQTEFTITITMDAHSLTKTEAKAATCTEEGNQEYWVCSSCGCVFADKDATISTTKEARKTDKIPHTPGSVATCTDDQICTICNTVLNQALGHDYKAAVTAPTCTEKGYTTHTCSRCGNSYRDSETSALGHTPGPAATCTDDQICTTCKTILNQALGHDYKAAVTAPTCTEKGYTTHTCSRCRDSYRDSETSALGHTPGTAATCTDNQICTVCHTELAPALGHNLGAWTTETPATCTDKGSESRKCSRCTYSESRETEALGHDYKAAVTAPTCTEKGYTTHACSRCRNSYRDSETSALGHSPGTAATCTDNQICTVCHTELAPALGHNLGTWTTGTPETCTNKGSESRKCSRCTYSESRETEALGHDYKAVVTAPTCTEKGYTTHVCSRCRDSYRDSETSALGHKFGNWVQIKAPTTEAVGEKRRECSRCNALETAEIPKHVHTVMTNPAVAATCVATGLTEGTHCSVCDTVIVKQEVVPALGHSFDDWTQTKAPTCTAPGTKEHVCSRCRYTENEQVPTKGHTPSPAATCTENQTCTACHIELAPALGHNLGTWKADTQATCTDKGVESRKCSRCDYAENRETEALGHDLGTWAADTPATCTGKGTECRKCSRCDYAENRETEALGHDLGNWTPDTQATCTDKGVESRKCSRCDYAESRETEALGHDYQETVTAPTCTEKGFTTFICTRCNDCHTDNETEAKGHAPGDWKVVTPATNAQEGVKQKECTVCHVVLETEEIPKLTSRPPFSPAPGPAPAPVDPELPEPPASEEWENPFDDITPKNWYYDSVEYVYENGMMAGVSETNFSPDSSTTRAMVVTVLYRLEEEPQANAAVQFTDVNQGRYYYEAVQWAADKGIVSGYGKGEFGPNDPITREQLAVTLWKYAGSPESTESLDQFTDEDKISAWAAPALQWAVEQGILSGKGHGILDPKGKASRAEVATMLMRYCEKVR